MDGWPGVMGEVIEDSVWEIEWEQVARDEIVEVAKGLELRDEN